MGNRIAKKKQISTELTPKQIDMLKASTRFTDKEIHDWHASFLRDCPSGKLDKKMFIDMYTQMFSADNAKSFCKYAFETFDGNQDGVIDFNEFLLAIAATGQGDLANRLEAAFEVYDVSNDGQIDQEELTNVISIIYDLTGETDRKGDRSPKRRAAEIISKFDVGQDKKLSKQEFIARCKHDPVVCRLLAPNVEFTHNLGTSFNN